MTFQNFVQSFPGLISALTMLLAATAAFFTAWRAYLEYRTAIAQRPQTTDPDTGREETRPIPKRLLRRQLVSTAIGGALFGAAATILVAWLLFPREPEPPTIVITKPNAAAGLVVELDPGGSARFGVEGESTGVAGKPARRILVLVHPEAPHAGGWWIQSEIAVEPSGHWSGDAWIGNKGAPAKPGHRFRLAAIVAPRREPLPTDDGGVPWVREPAQLEPEVTSDFVRTTVGKVVEPRK